MLACALYTGDDEGSKPICLRQFLELWDRHRRGISREAMRIPSQEIWPQDGRLTVGALWQNVGARAFGKAMGYLEHVLELETSRAGDGRPQQHRGTGRQR